MYFYRYYEDGKLFNKEKYDEDDVKTLIENNFFNTYFLPAYQHPEDSETPCYYPSGRIDTVEKLEQFLHPTKYRFVYDDYEKNPEWKVMIHTPNQLFKFWSELNFASKLYYPLEENLDYIRKCSGFQNSKNKKELEFLLNGLKEQSSDESSYLWGFFEGAWIMDQMENLLENGAILINSKCEYEFMKCPIERFNYVEMRDKMAFPTYDPRTISNVLGLRKNEEVEIVVDEPCMLEDYEL